MKTKILFVITFFALAFFNHASGQKSFGEAEAIKKVLDLETRSYFEMKYDVWASTWLQDSSAYRMTMSPTGFYKTVGWNNLNAGMKESMQTGTPYTEEAMAQYLHKFDYRFYINGNTAMVFFKEGNTENDANDETRLMVKRNGEWKISGLEIINTPVYNFNNDIQKIKSLAGKWKVEESSYKSMPPDSNYKMISFTYDVHETPGGAIEFASAQTYKYAGEVYTNNEYEQFVPDNGIMKFHYFDNSKSSNGYMVGGAGIGAFDSSGNFFVKEMYDNKPVVKLTNKYTMNKDGTIRFEGASFDTEGKQTQTWSFDMIRM